MFTSVLPVLDERQRRLLAGAQAKALGRGGIGLVARAAGMSRTTVSAAVAEVEAGPAPDPRVRRAGAGRPALTVKDPELLGKLDALVEPDTRGDPMCALRWTSKSTSHLAQALTADGHPVSADTVGRLLAGLGYSLQGRVKHQPGSCGVRVGRSSVVLVGGRFGRWISWPGCGWTQIPPCGMDLAVVDQREQLLSASLDDDDRPGSRHDG